MTRSKMLRSGRRRCDRCFGLWRSSKIRITTAIRVDNYGAQTQVGRFCPLCRERLGADGYEVERH